MPLIPSSRPRSCAPKVTAATREGMRTRYISLCAATSAVLAQGLHRSAGAAYNVIGARDFFERAADAGLAAAPFGWRQLTIRTKCSACKRCAWSRTQRSRAGGTNARVNSALRRRGSGLRGSAGIDLRDFVSGRRCSCLRSLPGGAWSGQPHHPRVLCLFSSPFPFRTPPQSLPAPARLAKNAISAASPSSRRA